MHYVVLGIDAPPLNDDDADGSPTTSSASARRPTARWPTTSDVGFRRRSPTRPGPTLVPTSTSRGSRRERSESPSQPRHGGRAFAVVSNNLDPSAERSFASVYATVAHELFHLVQFSYFAREAEPSIPTWILEGTASAMETRANPELDDLVSAIQLRRWFSATQRSITTQSYGAQLLWRRLDAEQPRLLPALFRRLAARPVAGRGRARRRRDIRAVAGKPFSSAFHRFAVSYGRPRRRDRARVQPPAGRRAVQRRAARRPLRPPRCCRAAAPTAHRPVPARTRLGCRDADVRARERCGRATAAPRADRRSQLGRRAALTFAVPAPVRANARLANPLLVVSNGGERPVVYAVSAR